MIQKPANAPGYGGSFVVSDWMVRIFGLHGDELLIYAIIHSFSKDGHSVFSGSISYLMFWTGKSKKTVISKLQYLLKHNLIERKKIFYTRLNKDRYYCEYWTKYSRLSTAEQKKLLYIIT